MSDISDKTFADLTQEEKQTRLQTLCKTALKALKGSSNLDLTEKELKENVVKASEKVNTISRQLSDGQEHSREEYNNSLSELNKLNRKLDKFLDNYEDLRDGTGVKLVELRDFLNELITQISPEQAG